MDSAETWQNVTAVALGVALLLLGRELHRVGRRLLRDEDRELSGDTAGEPLVDPVAEEPVFQHQQV